MIKSVTWSFIKQGPVTLQVVVEKPTGSVLGSVLQKKGHQTLDDPGLRSHSEEAAQGETEGISLSALSNRQVGEAECGGELLCKEFKWPACFHFCPGLMLLRAKVAFFLVKACERAHLSWEGRKSQLSLVWCVERRWQWLTNLSLLKVPASLFALSSFFLFLHIPVSYLQPFTRPNFLILLGQTGHSERLLSSFTTTTSQPVCKVSTRELYV